MHPPSVSRSVLHGALPHLPWRRQATARFAAAPATSSALLSPTARDLQPGPLPVVVGDVFLSFEDWMDGQGLRSD